MRPANTMKNEDIKRNIGPIDLFWVLIKKNVFIFKCGPPYLAFSLMRPARHFEFETPAVKQLPFQTS